MSKSKIFLILALILMYIPLFFLIVFSFNSGSTMNTFEGFTLANYTSLFANGDVLKIIGNSVIVAILSSMLATVIGSIGAIAIYQTTNPKKKKNYMQLNNIMILAPDVVIGVAFLSLFTMFSIKLGLFTVTLTHAIFGTPIIVITLLPRLEQIEVSQIKAALDLGAKSKDIARLILLPNIEDALITCFFISIFYSFDDFGVTFFVTGNGFVTLPIEIYSQARRGVSLELNALSTIMIFVIFVGVIIYYMYDKRGERNAKY